VFSPLRHEDGTMIYPGMLPGSELRAIDRLYAGKPFSDSQVRDDMHIQSKTSY
jgi:hypothetical protein